MKLALLISTLFAMHVSANLASIANIFEGQAASASSDIVDELGNFITEDDRTPHISFLGFSDIDVIDYFEGLFAGFSGKDVRSQWKGCVHGLPLLFFKLLGLMKEVIFSFADITKLITNFDKMKEIFSLMFQIFTEAPDDIRECEQIGTEIAEFIAWIVKHISLATVTTGLLTNLLMHCMDLFTDTWGMFSGVFQHDYYKVGKSIGHIVFSLFD